MCADSSRLTREAAFHDVKDSQATFRALLEALSRPGVIRQVPSCDYAAAPRGFCRPALTVLKTLCDHRVSFSVGLESRESELVRYLSINLTAPFRPVSEADYVLFDGSAFDEDFRRLNPGSAEFPESSATALVCVSGLAEGAAAERDGDAPCAVAIEGPGVPGRGVLSIFGLDPRYAEERRGRNRGYPLGIDVFFVDRDGNVAGIPRSSRVEVS